MIPSLTLRTARRGVAAAILLAASAGVAAAQSAPAEPRCAYTKRTVCSVEGCTDSEIGSSHLRIPPLPDLRRAVEAAEPIRVRRCDAAGCSPVEISQAEGKGFLTLTGQTGAYLIKIYDGPPIREIELNTGDFIEVVTSMLTTWVGYGSCSAAER